MAFDSLRTKIPWMKDLSDDEILLKTSAATGMDPKEIADYYGYDAPSSMMGKELSAGWENYKAGMGHIGSAMGIPGAAEWTAKKKAKAEALQSLSTAPHSFEEMKFGDPEKGALPYVGQLFASSAPYMAEAAGYTLADVATGGALTPAILARYAPAAARLGVTVPEFLGGQGVRAGATFAERRAALAAAEESAPALARTAMIPAVTYPSSLGDVLGNQQEEAGKYNLPRAMAAALPYSALNILGLEGAVTKGALPRLGIKSLEKNMAGRAASGVLATGASEAVNETGQEVMNQWGRMGVNPNATFTDPGALERYKESAIGGAILGGLPGSLHAFGGHRGPLDTKQPADLTKRLPDQDYAEQFGSHFAPEGLGLRTPEEHAAYTQKQAEDDLMARLNPGAAPAAPVYGTDAVGEMERAAGVAPGTFAPVPAAAKVKPKAAADAATTAAAPATAAATVDPVLQQVEATRAEILDAHARLFPEKHAARADRPYLTHQELVRWTGNPKTVDEAVATLKSKIVGALTQPGKGKMARRANAEDMLRLHDELLGLPEDQRLSLDDWEANLKAESALAAAKVGDAGKLPGAVTTVEPKTLEQEAALAKLRERVAAGEAPFIDYETQGDGSITVYAKGIGSVDSKWKVKLDLTPEEQRAAKKAIALDNLAETAEEKAEAKQAMQDAVGAAAARHAGVAPTATAAPTSTAPVPGVWHVVERMGKFYIGNASKDGRSREEQGDFPTRQAAQAWADKLNADITPKGATTTEVETPPAAPATPTEEERVAKREQLTTAIRGGLTDKEWEALRLTRGKEENLAGGVEKTAEELAKEQAADETAAYRTEDDEGDGGGAPEEQRADTIRGTAAKLGLAPSTFQGVLKRAQEKVAALAAQHGITEDDANELLGLQSSYDVAAVDFASTGYSGKERVATVDDRPELTGEAYDTTHGEAEAAATEGEGEGEEVAVEGKKKEVQPENKWVDAQGQSISHADVQDAAEDYGNHEMGYAAGDPAWGQLSPKLQLQWVRGYLAAHTMYPKTKQAPERRKFTDVVRTAMAEEQEQPNEADTDTAGADEGAGADRQAEEGADDAGRTEGGEQEVGGVSGTDEKADTGRVPPAATEGEKPADAEKAGGGTETAPVVKRKRKVAGGKAEAVSTPEPEPEIPETTGERALRKWNEAKAIAPELGNWGDLSHQARKIFTAAEEKDQKLADAMKLKQEEGKLRDQHGNIVTPRDDTKKEEKPAKKPTNNFERAKQMEALADENDAKGRPVVARLLRERAAEIRTEPEPEEGAPKEPPAEGGNMLSAIRAEPGVDMVRMAKLLGPQLYGNLNDIGPVTIKELFQNAFDAIKDAIKLGNQRSGEISVSLDENARTITLTDDGAGMTPEIINKAFLTLAGTKKETDRSSGGLGIAKMLFLFGNESLSLKTVRNGVESTLNTSGTQLMESFSDPTKAPDIHTKKTTDPSGTTITVKVPKTFYNEATDTTDEIKFPPRYRAREILESSPLFEPISVKLNGDLIDIGNNFPADEWTVLAVPKFAWGKVRVLVKPMEYPGFENVTMLSNGIVQFYAKIGKEPGDPFSAPAPYKFFFNIEPDVKADAPNYPIALNRKGFSRSAESDFKTLLNYLAAMYANTVSEQSSQSFGALSLFSEDGKTEKEVDLNVPKAAAGTTLNINKGDKVELRDGRMYVNNRAMPELTKEDLKAMKHDPGQFRVSQDLIDPNKLIVHDNVLLNDKPYLDEARAALGEDAVNGYLLGFARAFKRIRDAAVKLGGAKYADLGSVPVGVSIDTKYYGVNTVVPFKAMMLNPTVFKSDNIDDMPIAFAGTMVHEIAHHPERNHSETGFIPEVQRMLVTLSLSDDVQRAVMDLQLIAKDYGHVFDYFVKESNSGNLKNRGIRLEGGEERVGGEGDAGGTAGTSGNRGNAEDSTGLRQSTGASNQNRAQGQGRTGAPAANAGRTLGAGQSFASRKHLSKVHEFAQRHGLGFMITEDIADLAAANGLGEVRDYVEATKQREGARREFEAPVAKIAELYDQLPERERGTGAGSVNKFLHDATTTGSTTGINALSATGQQLVKAVFQHGKDVLALKKKLIEDEVGGEYSKRIAQETDAAKKAELVKERDLVLRKFSKLWTKGPSDTYAPLKRFGDYVVSAKSKEYVQHEEGKTDADRKWISANESDPAHVQMHFADTMAEAEALEAQIKQQYDFKGGKTYAAAREADIHNSRDLFRAFPVLQTRLEAEYPMLDGKPSPMARLMRDMYLEALAENTARKNELRRRNITGASVDMVRAFVTQGRADAHFLANLKHNDAVQKAVQAMRKGADRDRHTLTPYLNEMLKRHAASYENHSNAVANRFKRVTSIWMLATNPSYYLQQVAQPWVMSLPVIAGRHGYFRTARALREGYAALESVLKGTGLTGHIDWSQAPADVRDMLNAVSRNGAIDVTNSMDMGEWKLVDKGKAGAAWNRVDQKLRGLNTRVEAINRASTAIASYRLELARNGGDKVAATQYAEAMVRQTHGSYDGSNTPRYMQGSAAQVVSQFRRFQIIQLSLITRLFHNAFKGSTAEEKAIGKRALTYTLMHTFAVGGALGLPGAAVLASLVARLFGPSDEPPDFEKLAREAIGDQVISDLLLKGVPAMLGVDLSSKFGMGQILSVAPFADFPYDRKSFEKYAFAALGPVAGLGAKAVDGLAQLYAGHLEKGAELLLPTGLGNAMKGIRYGTEGVSLRKGDTVLSKDDISFADALLQGLGLPTTTITHQQRLSQTKYEFDTYYHDRTAALIQDYQQARKAGESVADVMQEWRDVQDARVRNGYARQPVSTLIKSAQQQRKSERNTAGGVEFVKANKKFVQEQANL